MAPRKLILACSLAACAIGLLGSGYWLGAGSMVYSTNCELRHIDEACRKMRSMQNWGGALMLGSCGRIAAIPIALFRKK